MAPGIPAEGAVRGERDTQKRPGFSHPPSSKGELSCPCPTIVELRGKPARALLGHQPPRMRTSKRQETPDLPNDSFTKAIVTPCFLKVNASQEHLKDPVQTGKALEGAKAH